MSVAGCLGPNITAVIKEESYPSHQNAFYKGLLISSHAVILILLNYHHQALLCSNGTAQSN